MQGKESNNFLNQIWWADFWKSNRTDCIDYFTYIIHDKMFIGYILRISFNKKMIYMPRTILGSVEYLKSIAVDNCPSCSYITFDLDDYSYSNVHSLKTYKELPNTIARQQYTSTTIINLCDIVYDEDINKFIVINPQLIASFNESTRRKTRKSLLEGWEIEKGNSKAIFEQFWHIYSSTSKRKNFRTHRREYYYNLLQKENAIIIIIKKGNKPSVAWFGISYNDTIVYLYGGNDDYSLSHFGQYFAHIVAMQHAISLGLKEYDMGGVEDDATYSTIKLGYRGSLVIYGKGKDIIINRLTYRMQRLIKMSRILKFF
jgi:lipid II:glycine glycyltransferase (peptidoglycan interpeptide bridge formation enzyme)